eukprot:876672-Pleurochrysis_carterae.AAC.1
MNGTRRRVGRKVRSRARVCARACARACVRARVRSCVRACVCARARICVRVCSPGCGASSPSGRCARSSATCATQTHDARKFQNGGECIERLRLGAAGGGQKERRM